MNELQRQLYLSALGVDSYMPRWHLPYAPQSQLCELPQIEMVDLNIEVAAVNVLQTPIAISSIQAPVIDTSPVNHLIGDILETKKVSKTSLSPISAADILAQLDTKPVSLDPFSLSIWRPVNGTMVIDSRNTRLALPTELFISNILRSLFPQQPLAMQEEVLRWPMIENSFAKRTRQDACNELQTWLTVQHEIRPLKFLFLMGENAANYFLPDNAQFKDCLFQICRLPESSLAALILPSLNELLQKPTLKQQLFFSVRRYISSNESI